VSLSKTGKGNFRKKYECCGIKNVVKNSNSKIQNILLIIQGLLGVSEANIYMLKYQNYSYLYLDQKRKWLEREKSKDCFKGNSVSFVVIV